MFGLIILIIILIIIFVSAYILYNKGYIPGTQQFTDKRKGFIDKLMSHLIQYKTNSGEQGFFDDVLF